MVSKAKSGRKKQSAVGAGILIGVVVAHLGGFTAPATQSIGSAVTKATRAIKSALRKKGRKAPCCKCACPACPGK